MANLDLQNSKYTYRRLDICDKIDDNLSVYLDLLRVLAATAVFIGHSIQFHLYDGWVPLSGYSREAVIIFFVLSGIVISATSARKSETIFTFFVARAARVYSVAIPAIGLCIFLGYFYAAINNWHFEQDWTNSYFGYQKFLLSITFLLQSWNDYYLPWNAPYWSLCYEVWYYIIFCALFFIPGRRGVLISIIGATIAGPAIIALFPIWWIGVELMRRPSLKFGNKYLSGLIFIASIVTIYLIRNYNIDILIQHFFHDRIPLFWRLHDSQRILTDYAIGLLVASNIVAFREVHGNLEKILSILSRPIKYISGYTFSIYLFHYPFVRLFSIEFKNENNSLLQYAIMIIIIFLTTICLGSITEKKKYIARDIIILCVSRFAVFKGRVCE